MTLDQFLKQAWKRCIQITPDAERERRFLQMLFEFPDFRIASESLLELPFARDLMQVKYKKAHGAINSITVKSTLLLLKCGLLIFFGILVV
jgi:hypothetical protein